MVLDAGEAVVVGGIASQGREGAWVSSFLVDTSMDNKTWAPFGGVYVGLIARGVQSTRFACLHARAIKLDFELLTQSL